MKKLIYIALEQDHLFGVPIRFAFYYLYLYCTAFSVKVEENRIYIRVEFTKEKSVKRPFCCTVSILEVYFTYLCYITCWALEYHFIENLKLLLFGDQLNNYKGSRLTDYIFLSKIRGKKL